MFSGVKVIPRDQIKGQNLDSAVSDGKKSSKRKDKRSKRKKSSRVSDSDDDDLDKIEKGSRKKKWYSSDEYSSYSSESDSGLEGSRRKLKKGKTKRKQSGGKEYSSEEYSSSDDTNERRSGRDSSRTDKNKRSSRKNQNKKSEEKRHEDSVSGDEINDQEIVRKQMGLDWMLRPGERNDGQSSIASEKELPVEAPKEEMKVNPRELNPYLRDNGSGYPEEQDGMKPDREQLLSSSVVGDGGASWRLKSLKRAKEQAAREGRQLDEVVAERWGSLGQLAGSLSSGKAAPSRAHLSAIKSRKRGSTYNQDAVAQEQDEIDAGKSTRDYLKDVSLRHSEMRRPKVNDSLSWGKRRGHHGVSAEDASLISSAFSSLNKFSNDGRFMEEALQKQRKDSSAPQVSSPAAVAELDPRENVEPREVAEEAKEELSANQLAAKALQLRLKGRHEEAQKLMEEVEKLKSKQLDGDGSKRVHSMQGTSRHISRDISSLKKQEDDADRHLARKIIQNKQYNVARQPDDEYDYDDAPRKKSRKKGEDKDRKVNQPSALSKRLLTQQERCLFCFENPNRPKHLVVSIANFTYLMLPQWQPVVPGHCCIVTAQHEASTRTVDNNVWDEIRNFKKCLIMMFAKQEKDLVFLETVMNLAQQRRHCLIECVPLPRDIAKEAPLYFKKAIDEAEDEWSQHNAKKLIDTSEKGLRASIPKDFPYFHVEFGLNRGFVHVIDDEKQFKSSLGLNVIRGMMQLPEEDMYRRRQSESVEVQRQAVASFAREWDPFDWTKQLG